MDIDLQCDDFLAANRHVYAAKAKRKKIAIVGIRATNRDTAPVCLLLGSAKLIAGGEAYDVADPAAIVRKLGTFTWDFLLYTIIDFHPIMALVDLSLMLSGPIYNRRLKRRLALLSNGELSLAVGESKSALVAFRGLSSNLEILQLRGIDGNGVESTLEYRFGSA